MGSSLTGQQIKNTYKSLIKTSDSTEASATAKLLSDGNGNDFGVYIDTDGVFGIGSAPSYSLDVSSRTDGVALPVGTTANRPTPTNGLLRYNSTIGKIEFYDGGWKTVFTTSGGTIDGSLIVTGDLTIQGTTVTLNTETVQFEDNILLLNRADSDTQYDAVNAGIEIEKTSATNPSFLYTYSTSTWGLTDSLTIEGDLTVDTNTLYVDSTNNRVGIGRTPSYKLDVSSVSRFTDGFYLDQATAGTNASIYLGSDQTLELEAFGANGEIAFSVGSSISEAMRIDSGGDISFRDTSNNEAFYWDASTARLSIGAGSSPAATLHVKNSTGSAVELLRLESGYNNPSGNKSIVWTDATDVVGRISIDYSAPTSKMRFGSIYNSGYQTGDLMVIDGTGNVGIGTTSITDYGSAANTLEVRGASGTGTGLIRASTADNSVGISMYAASSLAALNVQTNHPLAIYTNNTERMRIDSSGIVTIFTTGGTSEKTYSAAAGLELYSQQSDNGFPYTKTSDIVANGDGTVPSELRMFTKASGSSTPTERMRITSGGAIHLSQGTGNSYIGTSAGNLGTSTGTYNTGFGVSALQNNTTGYQNTAIGAGSLQNNTTGYLNTASGYAALYFNTTGKNNTANGWHALYGNTTGNENTAFGTQSLYSNTTGNNNTALGFQSLVYNTTGGENSAVGLWSLYSNTTGYANGSFGFASLFSNTTGYKNTAVGVYSLYSNTSGVYNTATGESALFSNTTGGYNTAYGVNGLGSNTTGSYNTTVGMNSLRYNTTGNYNTANGYNALNSNTTGYQNTTNGYASLYSNTTGYNNTALGFAALNSNTTGYYNTAIGLDSLYYNTTGYENTAVGLSALVSNTTGVYNTAVGRSASHSTTTGGGNTSVGFNALYYNSTGNHNTTVGLSAGNLITTGSNNTVLGYNAQASSGTVSNEITLGDANVTSLRCNTQTISSLSDARDKTNVEDLPLGLDFVDALRPVKFDWDRRDGTMSGVKDAGFIAQELDEAQSQYGCEDYLGLVYKSNPDKLEASYGKLVPVLVKAIQELKAEVESLKQQII